MCNDVMFVLGRGGVRLAVLLGVVSVQCRNVCVGPWGCEVSCFIGGCKCAMT